MPVQIETIMSRLVIEYKKYLKEFAKEESEDKKKGGSASLALIAARTFDGFISFCEDYLAEINPPTTTWFPGNGVGLILADSTRVVISKSALPEDAGATGQIEAGEMQDDNSVPITTGEGIGSKFKGPVNYKEQS